MKGIFCIEENLKSKENINAIQEFFICKFLCRVYFLRSPFASPHPPSLNIQIVYFLEIIEVRDIIKSHDVYLKFVFVIVNKLTPFYH